MQTALFELPAQAVTFDQFYDRYPNKKAREVARAAWIKAIGRGGDPQDILQAVEGYRRNKESWQSWLYPATFLNKDRWRDYLPQGNADSRIEELMNGHG